MLQKAVSRDHSKTFSVPCALVRDSWIIELVLCYMKFLACALKNKIKNKNFLFFEGCYAVATFKQLPKFATL